MAPCRRPSSGSKGRLHGVLLAGTDAGTAGAVALGRYHDANSLHDVISIVCFDTEQRCNGHSQGEVQQVVRVADVQRLSTALQVGTEIIGRRQGYMTTVKKAACRNNA